MGDERVIINGYSFPAGTVIPAAVKVNTKGLSADRARTIRAKASIASGRHPLRGTPLRKPAGATCGTCKHACRVEYNRAYWKCALDRPNWTKGPGSDIRVSWPACELYVDKSGVPGNPPTLDKPAPDPGNAPTLGSAPNTYLTQTDLDEMSAELRRL